MVQMFYVGIVSLFKGTENHFSYSSRIFLIGTALLVSIVLIMFLLEEALSESKPNDNILQLRMNLLYVSVFLDKSQLDYLRMLLFSIKLFSAPVNFDILVMTSEEFVEDIATIATQMDIPLKTMILPVTTLEEAYIARYNIFKYEHLGQYSKILYSDIDVLVQSSLDVLFNLDLEDKIYAVPETPTTIESNSHGAHLFDFSVVNKDTVGHNAGILLFKNTETIQSLFQDILAKHEYLTSKNTNLGSIGQALLNYCGVTKDLFGANILGEWMQLVQINSEPTSPLVNPKITMLHFFGESTIPKIARIRYHLTHLLHSLHSILSCKKDTRALIKYRQYRWNSGNILFDVNHLTTSWGRGEYKCINDYIYTVTWGGINHVIMFNQAFTGFISMRFGDTDYGYSHENTAFRDSIPRLSTYVEKPEAIIGDRYLIYFCVFYNKGYIDLLNYLFASLKMFSPQHDRIDFLVFTSEEFRSSVENMATVFNLRIQIKILTINSMIEASAARLRIFDYEHVNDYSKIMYLDTDIIIQGDIMKMFDCLQRDTLYVKKEYDIAGTGHGALFFDFTKFPPETRSLNAGVLLFRNSTAIRTIFHDIDCHMANLRGLHSLWPDCWDQSFIAYHFINNNACDNQTLDEYIFLSEHTLPPVHLSPVIISHFIWPIGNPYHKMGRMKTHLNRLIEPWAKVD